MRKYTAAAKDVADALKESVPVSEASALGDDWKKLPVGASTRSKAEKKISARSATGMALSTKKKAASSADIRIKTDTLEVTFNGVRFKAQGTPNATYAKGLAKVVKDYIKAHPVKS